MNAPHLRLATLVEHGMPALLHHYGDRLTTHQRRALQAITTCRTGACGADHLHCPDCGHTALRLRSCGHRCCPQCQHTTARDWLERQHAKLLPVDYFMLTFTLPSALRPLAYADPHTVYPAFFEAVASTLKTFGHNHPQLNAELGFTAVLHTHSRQLDYHPHLHVILPGGGVDTRERPTRLWRPLEGRYLFNGFALAKVFRARALDALRRTGLILPATLPRKWVVHCKHVGQGSPALKYLSRYLYRGVISERDLRRYDRDSQTVTFRYRHAATGRFRQRTLPIADFLWHIAMHVLPKGFQRVRHYGFLHGNARRLLNLVQHVLRVILPPPPPRQGNPFLCNACGMPMQLTRAAAAPPPSG